MSVFVDHWRMTRYSRFVPTPDGGGLRHNSFIRALARLDPATVARLRPLLAPLRAKNRATQPALEIAPEQDPVLA